MVYRKGTPPKVDVSWDHEPAQGGKNRRRAPRNMECAGGAERRPGLRLAGSGAARGAMAFWSEAGQESSQRGEEVDWAQTSGPCPMLGQVRESGVAAALCPRTPKRWQRFGGQCGMPNDLPSWGLLLPRHVREFHGGLDRGRGGRASCSSGSPSGAGVAGAFMFSRQPAMRACSP